MKLIITLGAFAITAWAIVKTRKYIEKVDAQMRKERREKERAFRRSGRKLRRLLQGRLS